MLGSMLRRYLMASLAVLSVAHAKSAALTIKNAKIAVTSPDGLSDSTYQLEPPTSLSEPIHLAEHCTLKLTFTAIDAASGDGVLPQQSHLLFEDAKGDDVTLPVTIKPNGRASWTLNTDKPISALIHTHGSLHVSLLLSSLDVLAPLQYPIGELVLPQSILRAPHRKRHDLPALPGTPAFQAEQELFHTFREDEKTVGTVKSAVGTALVLAPWIVLMGLYSQISPKLDYKSPPTSAYLFLGCLAALEGLIFVYWIGLKLYHLLPIFIPLSLFSAYSGKVALGELRRRKVQGR